MSDFSDVARCKKHGKFCPDDSGGVCPNCDERVWKTYVITLRVQARSEDEAIETARGDNDSIWKNCECEVEDED